MQKLLKLLFISSFLLLTVFLYKTPAFASCATTGNNCGGTVTCCTSTDSCVNTATALNANYKCEPPATPQPSGAPCTSATASSCSSKYCQINTSGVGTCQNAPALLSNGESCESASVCASGYCTGAPSIPGTCQNKPALLKNGASCVNGGACASGYCTGSYAAAGTCQNAPACLPDGASCAINGDLCCAKKCLLTNGGLTGVCGTSLTPTPTPFPPNPCPSQNGICMNIDTALGTINVKSASDFINTAFGIMLSLAGGIALLLIIFSGYRIMVSQGEPEQLKGAKEMLTSAIVGLLFIIFAVAILQIIGVDILQIPGFGK